MRCLGVSLFLLGFSFVLGLEPLPFNESYVYHLQQSDAAYQEFQKLAYRTPGISDIAYVQALGYTVSVSVGSPAQNFNLLLDLKRSRTWLTGTNCVSKCEDFCKVAALCKLTCYSTTCCASAGDNPNFSCQGKTQFNSTKSTTFKNSRGSMSWSISNGEQDSVKGIYAQDNFGFGDTVIVATDAEFGIATELSLSYTQWNADGVLGLAKKESTSADDSKPVLSKVTAPLFQVYFQKTCTSPSSCGTISVGSEGLNTQHICDTTNSVTFTSNSNDWGFQINSFEIKDPQASLSKTYQVAIDVNSQMIQMVPDLLKVIADAAKGVYDEDSGLYMISCGLRIIVRLGANDANFLILNENMLVGPSMYGDPTICSLQIEEISQLDGNSPNHIVLGAPVLTSYCQTYNLQDGTVKFYALSPAPHP